MFWDLGFAIVSTGIAFWLFGKLPTNWIWDYGQAPKVRSNFSPFPRGRIIGAVIYTIAFFLLSNRRGIVIPIEYDGTMTFGHASINIYELGQMISYVALMFLSYTLLVLLAHMAISDILNKIVPDQHVIAVGVIGALLRVGQLLRGHQGALLDGIKGGLVGFGLCILVLLIGFALCRKSVIGMGDIKLFTALGVLLGVEKVVFIFAFTNLISGIVAICVINYAFTHRKYTEPLGGESYKNQGANTIPLVPIINFVYITCVNH